MTIVRTATYGELEAIQLLDRLTLGDESRSNLLDEAVRNGHCMVALTDNEVAGFGILKQSFYGKGFIELLIVHPEHRRKRIATALIRHMETICPTNKLFTSTNESNIPAQKTYEANGFVRSGYIENLDEGDPEIIYFKRLAVVDGGG